MTKSIILVGGPDTGKTNYLARLVAHLRDGDGALVATRLPDDMRYIEDALDYLMKGEFAPRSHNTADELSGEIMIEIRSKVDDSEAQLSVPDVSGETWDDVAKSAEISQEWLDRVRAANGALLFVRILSDLNVAPLDWLTAPEMLALVGEGDERQFALPTQVMLCEFLRLLDENLDRSDGETPRVGVVITAWDRLDAETRAAGPRAFLDREYPLLAGKIASASGLDIGIFAASVVGGELADETFKAEYLDGDIVERGYIVDATASEAQTGRDITRPISWVLRFPNPD